VKLEAFSLLQIILIVSVNGLITLYFLPRIRYYIYWWRYEHYGKSDRLYKEDKYSFGNLFLAILFPLQFLDGDKLSEFSFLCNEYFISNYDHYAGIKKTFTLTNALWWYFCSVIYLICGVLSGTILFLILKLVNKAIKILR
jgi:hypothetical protein